MKNLFSLLLFTLIGLVNLSYSQTVTIGTQIWTTKNLDVSTFRNGDSIHEAKTNEEWKIAGQNEQPAWCYLDNDSRNGKLYNWFAISDPRGLGPTGWNIPTDDDWTFLIEFLGGENIAGKKIKTSKGWDKCEVITVDEDGYSFPSGNFIPGNGSDEVGFSSLPSGERWSTGEFQNKEFSMWWTSSEFTENRNVINENSDSHAWFYQQPCLGDQVIRDHWKKSSGHAVRLVMNLTSGEISTEALKEVKIGSQIWDAKNLNTNKFQNGDPIVEAKNSEEWIKYINEGVPAWCYYDFNPIKGKRLGKLYNWHAIVDRRNIAPQGWHIPDNKEWDELINSLGGPVSAGAKLKNSFGWTNEDGNNESGFAGLPSGQIDRNGEFNFIGLFGEWWSKSEQDAEFSYYLNIGQDYGDGGVKLNIVTKDYGFSIRCIKN